MSTKVTERYFPKKTSFFVLCSQLASLSGPMVFGGLGRLSMTSLASCDLLTMTSLSLTAVCIRRTLEESLRLQRTTNMD